MNNFEEMKHLPWTDQLIRKVIAPIAKTIEKKFKDEIAELRECQAIDRKLVQRIESASHDAARVIHKGQKHTLKHAAHGDTPNHELDAMSRDEIQARNNKIRSAAKESRRENTIRAAAPARKLNQFVSSYMIETADKLDQQDGEAHADYGLTHVSSILVQTLRQASQNIMKRVPEFASSGVSPQSMVSGIAELH
jgi:hypothetical protein